MSKQGNESAQTERAFIVTHTSDDGEYSRHLNYFLSNGVRRRVTIASASDSPELRDKIGAALHKRVVEG